MLPNSLRNRGHANGGMSRGNRQHKRCNRAAEKSSFRIESAMKRVRNKGHPHPSPQSVALLSSRVSGPLCGIVEAGRPRLTCGT